MKVAVVGGGINGLISAYVLRNAGVEVVLFEKEEYLGNHSKMIKFNDIDLDLGFNLSNPFVTSPNMMELFENLGVEMETSNMSFSVSLDKGRGYEWGTRNDLSSLFAQMNNIFNPYFWKMIREVIKFKDDVINYLDVMDNKKSEIDPNETLGQFLKSRGYSKTFEQAYVAPILCSIWSCSSAKVLNFSAFLVLSFLQNHYLLQLFGEPQWITIKQHSQSYVKKIQEVLKSRGCEIRIGSKVDSISTSNEGCIVSYGHGYSQEIYDACIIATHAPETLRILGKQATPDELKVLAAFQYVYSDIYLHGDKDFMPQNPKIWSAWNFLGNTNNKVYLTYWLNVLLNLGETSLPFLATLNPEEQPKDILFKWSTGHSIPTVDAFKALNELHTIQGKRKLWFCGAYQGYGSLEDGVKACINATHNVLGKSFSVLNNPKCMVPSLTERGARLFVTKFLCRYISIGSLTIMEEGGKIFTFKGIISDNLPQKVVLRVHTPQFYWKIMTQADLGLADAYINGDFSFMDKNEGLLNLILVLIANKDTNASIAKLKKRRGWWSPPLFTASIASAKYFYQHASRKNSIAQARTNISRHYDLSNELFSLFLDDTMTYSCAIFKREDEDLRIAQLRKISILIKKARINKNHKVLDIGCGWGTLAIEIVKQTGCHCTGITLSKEQFKYAQNRVKDLGLQDHIEVLLCDYRQLSNTNKYDRIISCGMIEAVGHEFMEDFFSSCESVLAENGLLVLQFISTPDESYEEYRLKAGFIKEYIFQGGCLPSLSRITTAMANASRLSVEHLENIGIHYYQTLRFWRKNFLNNKSKILELGFDERFLRTWEYYFDYCAAGFKSRTLGDYQIVFSRPGNVATFEDPYEEIPSAFNHSFEGTSSLY
ncbi:uncharacterized protein LOC120078371 [Benincasa hispida]|uniref:uncharacterized protein LOC120078371 n=1 Tax=Benincasa hispida TaxID=102211 RepID=UPI001901B0A0|nr:uncharacterized protein LOC120078371 [Benincasa hispida]